MTPRRSITYKGERHMNRSGSRPRLAALLISIVTCVGLLSLSTAPAWAAAGTITEFPTPTGSGDPIGITAGPDGNLWFTAWIDIGRSPTNAKGTGFPFPPARGRPQSRTTRPGGDAGFAG